jgi:DNA-directed RNA polymerase alpha subunit
MSIQDELAEVFATPLVGRRVRDMAFNLGITTIQELAEMTRGEMLRQPNVGRLTVDTLEQVLIARGLRPGPPIRNRDDWWQATLSEQT